MHAGSGRWKSAHNHFARWAKIGLTVDSPLPGFSLQTRPSTTAADPPVRRFHPCARDDSNPIKKGTAASGHSRSCNDERQLTVLAVMCGCGTKGTGHAAGARPAERRPEPAVPSGSKGVSASERRRCPGPQWPLDRPHSSLHGFRVPERNDIKTSQAYPSAPPRGVVSADDDLRIVCFLELPKGSGECGWSWMTPAYIPCSTTGTWKTPGTGRG